MMRKHHSQKNTNAGFTLVELIVVLVILAVLAAILIPALLGWIDKAREKQELLDAKYCLTTIQAQLTERYALNGGTIPEGKPILYLEGPKAGEWQRDYWINKTFGQNTNGDVNATRQTDNTARKEVDKFATPILRTLEAAKDDKDKNKVGDPYCVIFGVGSNATGTSSVTTKHDKYTVYFLFYMKEKNSTPMFYFDGQWTTSFPKDAWDSSNVIKEGKLKGKRLQFYSLSNQAWTNENGGYSFPGTTKEANKKFWDWMKSFK